MSLTEEKCHAILNKIIWDLEEIKKMFNGIKLLCDQQISRIEDMKEESLILIAETSGKWGLLLHQDLYFFREGQKRVPEGIKLLPVQIINALAKEGPIIKSITTPNELFMYTQKDLLQKRGIGQKNLGLIMAFTKSLGVNLREK